MTQQLVQLGWHHQISPSIYIRWNCQKICSWTRGRETMFEIRESTIILIMINKLISWKTFKGDSNKIYRMILFSCRPIHLIGNTWITGVKGKDIEKIHLYMYEVSSSQRFRTVNVIQIWPDASEESRAILSFLTILGSHYLFGNIFAVEIFANVENFGQIRENLSRETRKFYYFQKFIH